MDVIVESKKKEKSSAIINSVALLKKKPTSIVENVPSGFILKLYQMVNGAPDEVITVSSLDHLQFLSDKASKWLTSNGTMSSNNYS